jgi:hypothetical protein
MPTDVPEELGEVAPTGRVNDAFDPAGFVSEPEHAALASVNTRIVVTMETRPDPLDCPLFFATTGMRAPIGSNRRPRTPRR